MDTEHEAVIQVYKIPTTLEYFLSSFFIPNISCMLGSQMYALCEITVNVFNWSTNVVELHTGLFWKVTHVYITISRH